MTRRTLLQSAFAAGLAAASPRIRVAAMDGVLRQRERTEAVDAARRLGLDGVEVECGKAGPNSLPISNPELQARYRAAAREHGITLAGAVLGALHDHCLKNDDLAPKLVNEAIQAAANLRIPVLLLPLFYRCSTTTADEVDHLVGLLKDLAPEARRRHVTLGLENVLSAEANARILDRVHSPALKVYYDVGNSTNLGGFDAPREIRWLGRDRICQFHFKDKRYLGEGKVNFPAVAAAIRDIGYRGFVVLETPAPSGDALADAARNLVFVRKLFA